MRIEHKDANDISDPWIWLCGKANFGSFNCLKKIKVFPKLLKYQNYFLKIDPINVLKQE